MKYYLLLARSIFLKDALYIKRYWFNSVFSIIIMLVFFLILAYGNKYLTTEEFNNDLNRLLSGYVVWLFMSACFSTLVNNISNEANLGTLEQLYINSKSFYLTLILQAISAFFILFIQITLFLFFISLCHLITFQSMWNYLLSIPIFLLGMPALWGMGLCLAAMALSYKNITSIYTVLSTLFFALISYISNGYYSYKYIVIPFASASNCIQDIMNGKEITCLSVVDVMLNSVLFLMIGIFFFKKYEKKSKNNAKFAQH